MRTNKLQYAVVFDPATGLIKSIRGGHYSDAAMEKQRRLALPCQVLFVDDVDMSARSVSGGQIDEPDSVAYRQARSPINNRMPVMNIPSSQLGLPLDPLPAPEPKPKRAGQPEIAVVRLIGIGDVIMTIPLLVELRRLLPDVYLSYWTSSVGARVLNGLNLADRIEVLEWKHPKTGTPPLPSDVVDYDAAINLINVIDFGPQTWARPRTDNFFMAANNQLVNILGCELLPPTSYEMPAFHITDDQRRYAIEFHAATQIKTRLVGCQLSSHGDCRFWPTEKWIELAQKMPDVTFLWFSDAYKHSLVPDQPKNVINTSNQLNFEQFTALLAHCHAIVCPDTSGMHLAEMMRVPCLVLEGSTNIEYHTKYYRYVSSVRLRKPLRCQPCYDWQLYYDCYKQPDAPWCLTKLDTNRVKKALEKLL